MRTVDQIMFSDPKSPVYWLHQFITGSMCFHDETAANSRKMDVIVSIIKTTHVQHWPCRLARTRQFASSAQKTPVRLEKWAAAGADVSRLTQLARASLVIFRPWSGFD